MIPQQHTIKYKIGDWLHRNPGSKIEAVFRALPGRRENYPRVCVSELIAAGLLTESNGLLNCGREFNDYFAQLTIEEAEAPKVDLVPPRTAPAFKPLSAKNMLPKVPTRDDAQPLRDIYFKTGSVGFPVGYQV